MPVRVARVGAERREPRRVVCYCGFAMAGVGGAPGVAGAFGAGAAWGAGAPGAVGALGAGAPGAAGAAGRGAGAWAVAFAPKGSWQNGHLLGRIPSTGNTVRPHPPHATGCTPASASAGLKHIRTSFVIVVA